MAHEPHAQADLNGVLLILTGNMDVRLARFISANTTPFSSKLDRPRSPPARTALASNDTGKHEPAALAVDGGEPRRFGQHAKIGCLLCEVATQRQRLAKRNARVAVATSGPCQPQPRLA
jgi:hypothetical protein